MRRLAAAIGWMLIFALLQGCGSQESGANDNRNGQGGLPMKYEEDLLQAVERRDTTAVKKLLAEGAQVDAKDNKERTALMIATYNNDVATAHVLIAEGADVNAQDDMLNSPFLYAGAEGYLDVLKLTIAAGADPAVTNRYGGTALIPASEHGYVEVVRLLLTETTVDVNHVNRLGWTALLEAILLNDGGEKQQQTISLLIEHGADVNLPDADGVSPLSHARSRGFDAIVRQLEQAGAK
ncbi:ankyrin repeat domain-containing protein [Paenibacillus sp. NPDC058071]|uniref:ankyrin repeat domain-containing protein n=1 Tax=Paenibacillus sp. NPDC058071 TaxID=3346326 RepID=UPI0036DE40F4